MKHILLLLLCTGLIGCAKGPAEVRVQNLTGHALAEISVQDTAFGPVPDGSFSASKEIPVLNHDPSVKMTEANGDIRNRLVVHDPKGPVGAGKFVVALTFDKQGGLHVQVSRDDWRKLLFR